MKKHNRKNLFIVTYISEEGTNDFIIAHKRTIDKSVIKCILTNKLIRKDQVRMKENVYDNTLEEMKNTKISTSDLKLISLAFAIAKL